MSGVASALEGLHAANGALRSHWDSTSSVWDDVVSSGFDREYLAPLETQTAATLKAMATVAEVIGQARRSVK